MVYLDHAATTPLHPEARRAMEPFLGEVYGNPSSLHAAGQAARRALDDARDRVALALEAVRLTAGDRLVVVEAMKMEHVLTAPVDGVVRDLRAKAGATVAKDAVLLTVEGAEAEED